MRKDSFNLSPVSSMNLSHRCSHRNHIQTDRKRKSSMMTVQVQVVMMIMSIVLMTTFPEVDAFSNIKSFSQYQREQRGAHPFSITSSSPFASSSSSPFVSRTAFTLTRENKQPSNYSGVSLSATADNTNTNSIVDAIQTSIGSIMSSTSTLAASTDITESTSSGGGYVGSTFAAGADVGAGLSPLANTIIFIIGIIPFLWATYEFWSRIAVGSSFGTGQDSIQIRPSSDAMKKLTTIGKDGDLKKSRGQQVLGDDALLVAYFLFAVAIGSVGIAVYSVISSPMDMVGAGAGASPSAGVGVGTAGTSTTLIL